MIEDETKLSRCDCLAFLYEDDEEQIDYVKEYIEKFSEMIPKVLIRNKIDIVQESSRRTTAVVASDLGIIVWKECSAKEKRIREAVAAMLDVAMNPSKGLSQKGIELATKRLKE